MERRPWHEHYDHGVATTMRYPRMGVHELLRIPANSFPDKAAIRFLGTDITFRQLRDQVLAMANALGALGVGKGDRVALHLPNCPQYVIAYYAALSLGAIVVNVNPMLTPRELAGILGETGATVLFTCEQVLAGVRSALAGSPVRHVVATSVTDFVGAPGGRVSSRLEMEAGWHHFVTLLESSPVRRWPRVTVGPEDPALIVFTGGTTGVPKGAVLTHRNVVAAAMQVTEWGAPAQHHNPIESRNVLGVIPYFHVYGNTCVLNWSMLNCATQILLPRFDIDEVVEVLGRVGRLSFFPAVPTMIIALLNHPAAAKLDLAHIIRCLNSGSGPLAQEVIWQLYDLGIFYTEGLGMTETSSLAFANPLMGMKKVGSIGIPYIDADVRLVDPVEGREEVGANEPGEILIKSPLVMREYWNRPEETAAQLRDGWLSTGDIAVRDDDSYFFVVDRKKDMIIAGGYNIYPREIDEVLHQHPKVLNACSVGVPDAYRGETVKAFVVLKSGQSATAEEIVAFCRERLAAYKAPKLVEFRASLPQSAIGKVLRRILRDEELERAGERKNG